MSASKTHASEKELKKLGSYIIFDSETGDVKRIVFPNSVQVGLASESFASGTFNVSGTIESSLGISGSLTRLVDGRSYLSAGTNVTITSESNGQITITAAGGSSSPGGSDTQLQYNNGGAFDGIASFTWDDTDLTVGTTTKLKFRDAGLFVHSPDDGYLVIDSDTRLAITGSGAVPNAISLITDNAAGGIDIDSGTGGYQNTSTGKIHLTSSINSGDSNAIQLLASAGGIQINAVGAAGEDVSIINTGGSINLSATETASDAINIDSSGGVDIDAADEITLTTTTADGHISLVSAHTAGVAVHIDANTNAGSIVDIDAGILQIDATGVADINSGGTLSLGTANSNVAVNIGHGNSEVTVGDNLNISGNATVVGNLGVNGIITGSMGLSGSLTRLVDGTSYLAAGSNVTITSASNGQVTITAAGGSGSPGGNDTQLQYNNGGSFDGISAFTWDDTDLLVSTTTKLQFRDSGLYINSPADGKLHIDSDSQVLIMSGGAPATTNEGAYPDINFFVSGSMGSKGTATKGTALFGGDTVISGSLHVKGGNTVGGATSAAIILDSTTSSKIVWDSEDDGNSPDAAVYESGGSLYLSSSNDVRIYAGTDDILLYPKDMLQIIEDEDASGNFASFFAQPSDGVYYNVLDIGDTGVIINDDSRADYDFRVESDSNTHMFFIDSGNNTVGVNTSSPIHALSVVGAVSASLGYSGSLTKLIDGTSYLAAGSNVTITSASNGQVTIAASSGGGGGGSGDYQAKSSDFTVGTSEYMFGITTSGGHLTGTLPAASSAAAGKQYIFKDTAGYAGQTLKGIHIATNGSEKIDGASAANILVNSGSMTIMTDGSNWFVIGIS
tara:strand:- start:22311 stop:24845 length:2535 start_codon:yes stop_codon:yes gene_type:complete